MRKKFFFVCVLMLSSIKTKIKQYYDANVDVFRRKVQAVWNTRKEKTLHTKQLNYEKLQSYEQNRYNYRRDYNRRIVLIMKKKL